jgi:putative membrane protein
MNCKIPNLALACVFSAGVLLAAGPAAQAQMGRSPQSQEPPANLEPYPNQPGANMPDATTNNTVSDADFAKEAAEGGMAEVKLGQLAQDKGANQAVKDFGKRMVDDHTQADEKLQTIAGQEHLKIPTALDKHDQAEYDKLSKLSGDAFDRAYARDMVKDHQNDIAAFRQEADNGRDNGIKTFASETLPTLQDHLKMAREMKQTVRSSGATKGGAGSE